MDNRIIHNCKICSYYEWDGKYEDKYDFYEKSNNILNIDHVNGYCFLGIDTDIKGNIMEKFDKNCERRCCILDILLVVRIDKDLQKAKDMKELMNLFYNKYPDSR